MVKKSKTSRSIKNRNKKRVSKKTKSKNNYKSKKSKKGGSAGIRLNLNRYNNQNNK